MITILPALTKQFCLNAKPFTEIFIVPKQTIIIRELRTYFFGDASPKSLNLEEKEKCEGMLTKAECLQALKSMKSGKTPGSDGLPVEFYNVFWSEISDCLLNTTRPCARVNLCPGGVSCCIKLDGLSNLKYC